MSANTPHAALERARLLGSQRGPSICPVGSLISPTRPRTPIVNKGKLDDAHTQLRTINEVAQRRVSARTVRRQIEIGNLRYYRIGRAIRVSEDDLGASLKRAKR